jgi:DNA-directed RNA polymerase specialized sigma24 family protein
MQYESDSGPARFLHGDEETVAQISRWISQVLATARFRAIRSHWPDLHQEVQGRLIESFRQGRYDPARELRVYVQGIARFTAFKAMSRWSTRERGKVDVMEDGSGLPATGSGERDLIACQLARRALELSSDECGGLIRAYFLEERTYGEIAQDSGNPVGTVKSRLFRCLEKIHRDLVG